MDEQGQSQSSLPEYIAATTRTHTATSGSEFANHESRETDVPPPRLLKEQDRFLPIANISRLMKGILPENSKVSKDAKESIQECVSEFICFITSEASDMCAEDRQKCITAEDLFKAMDKLGFEMYSAVLKPYFEKYQSSTSGQSSNRKGRRRQDTPSAGSARDLDGPASANSTAVGAPPDLGILPLMPMRELRLPMSQLPGTAPGPFAGGSGLSLDLRTLDMLQVLGGAARQAGSAPGNPREGGSTTQQTHPLS